MNVLLIRHGKTKGNEEKRYIGKTDEDLSVLGANQVLQMGKNGLYPEADIVITSPMKRCVQTAELIYKDKLKITEKDLRECDFGSFEGKNYIELSEDLDYKKWIKSNGELPFPKGESKTDFIKRCVDAFSRVVFEYYNQEKTIAFVVHGGTIMAILDRLADDGKSYYDYQSENGCGFMFKLEIVQNNICISEVMQIKKG